MRIEIKQFGGSEAVRIRRLSFEGGENNDRR